jgi:hypothetical protein
MRCFALIHTTGGVPELDAEATPYHGYVLCAQQQDWGIYLVSGTKAQLDAIAALPATKAIQIVQVSQAEERFPELKATMVAKPALTSWLSTAKEAPIDTHKTTGENLEALVKKWNPAWSLAGTDVDEPKADVKPVEEQPIEDKPVGEIVK